MNSIDRIVNPPKNIILRMWVFAGIFVAAVFCFVLWDERFRAEAETDEVYFGILGIEQNGKIRQSFSGSNFSVRMSKMGLSLAPARTEALKKLAEMFLGDEERFAEFGNVPLIWIYADGRTPEAKDEAYKTLGKALFVPEKFCFSVADPSGFSIQIDPKILTIFRAKTGEAIAAFPLLQRPPNSGKFDFKIFARNAENVWAQIGNAPFDCRLAPDNPFPPEIVAPAPALSEKEREEQFELGPVAPDFAQIRKVVVPKTSRFYSDSLSEIDAFGNIELEIRGNEKIPAHAWSLENVSLQSESTENPQSAPWKMRDAFHSNVRFFEEDAFENYTGTALSVPLAKTLFPRAGEKWKVTAALVRKFGFAPEEIREFPELKLSKVSTPIRFAGSAVNVRAFLDEEYYRLLAGSAPALILEIAGTADWEKPGTLFWQPFRLQTDTREELLPESVVIVRPGVYQYWYIPRKKPKKVRVTYAVTRPVLVSSVLEPEVKTGTRP